MKHARPPWLVSCFFLLALEAVGAPNCGRQVFGHLPDGTEIGIYTLRNASEMQVKVMDLGATLVEVRLPDAQAKEGSVDVVVGFDKLSAYEDRPSFVGATVGRVANRIGGASFMLDGVTYHLEANSLGQSTLHGGSHGFDKRAWHSRIVPGKLPAVEFTLESPEGDEGFPGRLSVRVRYTLLPENVLRIDYEAAIDRTTPVNLTNHSFFNLAGQGAILDHTLQVAASYYTPTDDALIPTGEIAPVAGTRFDFRTPCRIGGRIDSAAATGGYDNNFVLDRPGSGVAFCARLEDPASHRAMEVWTTEPGVQLNTGNRFDGKFTGTNGHRVEKYAGCAFETQHFPDALHHSNFPSILFQPGQAYRSTTEFRFFFGDSRRKLDVKSGFSAPAQLKPALTTKAQRTLKSASKSDRAWCTLCLRGGYLSPTWNFPLPRGHIHKAGGISG